MFLGSYEGAECSIVWKEGVTDQNISDYFLSFDEYKR